MSWKSTNAVMPSVPLEAALAWLKEQENGAAPSESALVHVPIYIMKYVFNGTTYTAVVEAATGAVLANLFPAKAEAPYLAIALVTAAVYLCLALAVERHGSGAACGLCRDGGARRAADPAADAWRQRRGNGVVRCLVAALSARGRRSGGRAARRHADADDGAQQGGARSAARARRSDRARGAGG